MQLMQGAVATSVGYLLGCSSAVYQVNSKRKPGTMITTLEFHDKIAKEAYAGFCVLTILLK